MENQILQSYKERLYEALTGKSIDTLVENKESFLENSLKTFEEKVVNNYKAKYNSEDIAIINQILDDIEKIKTLDPDKLIEILDNLEIVRNDLVDEIELIAEDEELIQSDAKEELKELPVGLTGLIKIVYGYEEE
jgi:hypothetical protein